MLVDDFFVKYRSRAAAEPLIAALKARYKITQDESASEYLGLKLDWQKSAKASFHLPGYINHIALDYFTTA